MSLTALLFLAVFFGLCVMGLFGRPTWALGAYVATFYVHPNSKWWGSDLPDLRWSLIAALVLLVSVVKNRPQGFTPLPMDGGLKFGFAILLSYMVLQFGWALSADQQEVILVLFVKYLVLMVLLHLCFQDEELLRRFFLFHVIGCGYLGVHAWERAAGGRFENFGGPGIGDANTGAALLATGLIFCAAFVLAGRRPWQLAGFLAAPFILNGVILTQSRGGTLAMAAGFLAFLALVPGRFTGRIFTYGVLGLVLLLILTPADFWARIATVLDLGDQQVEEDVTAGRMDIIAAQFEMFNDYPLGTGHRGTALLSPYYMDQSLLTNFRGSAIRASHNAYMTLVVNYGIFGLLFCILWLIWLAKHLLRARWLRNAESAEDVPMDLRVLMAASGASLVALAVGDLASDFLKLEPRIWYLAAFSFLLLRIAALHRAAEHSEATLPA